ncbi:MAG: glycoside hydrolase family 127 protein, partial [Chloroflexi bacterium]|nr:glycoside hydrolase family 127 protein [Chloroflexota bacterium]
MMQPLLLANLFSSGELYRRAMLNFDRLELPDYQPPAAFRPPEYDWPGDAEGRVLMAWILLAQATHREPRYLEAMLEQLPAHLNARGYLGQILPDGEFDEQQFSGHGWVLRALCELYRWRPQPALLQTIERIIRGLVLPAHGYYKLYPSQPEQRIYQGEVIGQRARYLASHWYPSTDIGSAFTVLDGATQAYQLLGWPELAELIEEAIASYAAIDKVQLSFQTHSTLSTLRAVLRYYATAGRAQDLELAESTYALYRSQALTANWANFNWFGRPTWTEPCAVMDSFIVAQRLWQYTGETSYLEDAQRILYNGMAYGQRPNGGYGCDVCAGAGTSFLAPKVDIFEASWCCTMRGGEGLTRAVEFSHWLEGDNLYLPYYDNALALVPAGAGELCLIQRSDYPRSARVALDVVRASAQTPFTINLYIPSWVQPAAVTLAVNSAVQPVERTGAFYALRRTWQAGDAIVLDYPLTARCEPALPHLQPAGRYSFWHGPLLLGLPNQGEEIELPPDVQFAPLGSARYQAAGTGCILAPTDDLHTLPWDAALHDRRQVLFRAND